MSTHGTSELKLTKGIAFYACGSCLSLGQKWAGRLVT